MENQEQQNPGITLNDIANAAQVIDVAVSRGAFRAAEVAGVGAVYNRLTEFLQANQPAEEVKDEENPQEEPSASE